jgi:hypothetical protein
MERGRCQARSDEKAFALGREIAIEAMLRRGEPDAPNHEIAQIMAGINYGLQKRIGREVVLIKGYPKRWLFMQPVANILPIPG